MEPLYKIHITIPLPKSWMHFKRQVGMLTPLINNTRLVNGLLAPLSDAETKLAYYRFLRTEWERSFEEDWKEFVEETFLTFKLELSQQGRDIHLLNIYDNTNPIDDHVGRITLSFRDRDTALIFKLSYEG